MNVLSKYLPFVLLVVLFSAAGAVAQKAEPLRIKFAKGKTSATVTDRLSGDEEMDLVFGASKGQTVTLKVTSDPAGKLFNFKIGGDGFEFGNDEESYEEYSFEAPETGDYLVWIRKLPSKKVPSAKFYLILTIR